jgi:uncharacterized protein (DUF433 family)
VIFGSEPIPLHIPEGVPLYRDERGTVRVCDSRVLLDIIIGEFILGSDAEEISSQYTTVSAAAVEKALAYYKDHKNEVDEHLRIRRERADKIRVKMEAQFNPDGLREKLLARQRSREQAE